MKIATIVHLIGYETQIPKVCQFFGPPCIFCVIGPCLPLPLLQNRSWAHVPMPYCAINNAKLTKYCLVSFSVGIELQFAEDHQNGGRQLCWVFYLSHCYSIAWDKL